MSDEKKKGLFEEEAERAGEVVGKIAKKGWGLVKSFGKGIEKEIDKKEKENK
jgi:hypothetical protein